VKHVDTSIGDQPSEDLVKQVMGLVVQLTDQARTYVDGLAEELNLTHIQAVALMNLEKPIPMSQLASVLSCERSNITGLVDRMEKQDLVSRNSDATDRRVKTLVLTRIGEKTRDELSRRIFDESPMTNRLNATEMNSLASLLHKLTGTADKNRSPDDSNTD
jgi:DNA-binding MarR family transcriptional regulator